MRLNKMNKLPDTSQAEKWLDPDTFVVNGRLYRIEPDGTIKEVRDEDREYITNTDK
jgi:hypothetical protein